MSTNTASRQQSCTIIEIQPEALPEEPRGAHARPATGKAEVREELRVLPGRPANEPPVPRHASAPRRFWLGMQGIEYKGEKGDRIAGALGAAALVVMTAAALLL